MYVCAYIQIYTYIYIYIIHRNATQRMASLGIASLRVAHTADLEPGRGTAEDLAEAALRVPPSDSPARARSAVAVARMDELPDLVVEIGRGVVGVDPVVVPAARSPQSPALALPRVFTQPGSPSR